MGEAEELTERFERLRSDLMNARAFLMLAGLEDSWTTQPLIEHQMDLLLPPPTPLRVPYERLRISHWGEGVNFVVPPGEDRMLSAVVSQVVLTKPLWWIRLWNATTRAQFDGDVPLSLSVVNDLILTIPIASFLEGILVGDIRLDVTALLALREETLQQAENSMLPGLPRNT